ncbi:hypothetical protein C1645_734325 [Glomus cerebriforme]|uniref:F-box domain-containing protein n=1 Tax=Glomus cerebriforme TaxID=658196 RepID=A0A397TF10_9GLOM|nr:hypothetical protein C1645_734325 [Glomus cerebriforme]
MKHAHNIIHLLIEKDLEFFETLFPKLINIQKLELRGCTWTCLNLDKELDFVYSYLQVLNISNTSYCNAIEIIQKTTGSIQKIWTDSMHYNPFNNSGNFILKISQHCPNLKYIKIALKDQYLDKLELLLTACKLLEGLHIYKDLNNKDHPYKFSDKLLITLVKFAPMSLYKIGISYCNFKISILDWFFNNWKGRKTLCLYSILDRNYQDCFYNLNYISELKTLIEKYINEGVIKKFHYGDFDDEDFRWCF